MNIRGRKWRERRREDEIGREKEISGGKERGGGWEEWYRGGGIIKLHTSSIGWFFGDSGLIIITGGAEWEHISITY